MNLATGKNTVTRPAAPARAAAVDAKTKRARAATRDELVLEHVSLVRALAQRLAQRLPSQVEMSDLVSVGVLGLMDAATRYRPSTGVPFDAFARRRIQGAMLDALRDLDWAPRSLRKLRRDLDAAMARLRHELGRDPEDAEIAKEMALSPEAYDRALDQVRSLELGALRQLDVATSEGTSLLELCIDPDDGPEVRLQRSELREHLARALVGLPDRERQILALYYEEELTMAEIGEVIGVCESRISQLRSLALSRLRVSLRASLGPAGAALTGTILSREEIDDLPRSAPAALPAKTGARTTAKP